MFYNFFGKVKKIKALVGFKLMTYRFVVNAVTHYATLFGNKIGKDKIF